MSEISDKEHQAKRQGEQVEGDGRRDEQHAARAEEATAGRDQGPGQQGGESGAVDEELSEILRTEVARLQEELGEAKDKASDMQDRYLRARADLDNYRKRATAEADRAREAGLDSAVLPVLAVFDDLRRALEAAEMGDPSQIIPGVQTVLATLERNLEGLGIATVGNVGDRFDPDLHEALTSIPTEEAEKADTIAEVFQLGFQKGDRLIRPARVVVYQS